MATQNGANALGVDAGIIAPGLKADVIVIDLTKNMMFTPLLKQPVEKRKEMLESHLVFGCNGTGVQHVFVDGRQVLKDFGVVGFDEEKVRREMDELFEELHLVMERERMDSRRK